MQAHGSWVVSSNDSQTYHSQDSAILKKNKWNKTSSHHKLYREGQIQSSKARSKFFFGSYWAETVYIMECGTPRQGTIYLQDKKPESIPLGLELFISRPSIHPDCSNHLHLGTIFSLLLKHPFDRELYYLEAGEQSTQTMVGSWNQTGGILEGDSANHCLH